MWSKLRSKINQKCRKMQISEIQAKFRLKPLKINRNIQFFKLRNNKLNMAENPPELKKFVTK